MANIIIIEDDSKLDRAMRALFNEQGEHKIRGFTSGKDFEDRYFKFLKPHNPDNKIETPSDEKPADENDPDSDVPEELRLLSQIDLIVFRMSCVEKNTGQWVSRVQNILQANKFWPPGNRTRFIVTKYEDDGLPKSHFLHPHIDDLILLPLDRLLFLQKIEIVLGLPNNTSPSYLFTQEVEMDIEISKRSRIERLSDIGLAIRNPVSLISGLLGHFFFKFPESKGMLDVYGKVQTCEQHPEHPDEFLVYFIFFGIDKDTLTQIRRYLATKGGYKPLINQDPQNFVYNPDDVFISDELKAKKNVVILDIDPSHLESMASMIKGEIGQVTVFTDTSYTRFFQRHLGSTSSAVATTTPASVADFYADEVSWSIANDSDNLIKLLSSTKTPQEDLLLGHTVAELFSAPTEWLKLFANEEALVVLREMIDVARDGQSISNALDLTTKDNSLRKVEVRMKAGSDDDITVTLLPPKQMAEQTRSARLESLDMIIINQHLVPHDVESWLTGLHEAAQNKALLRPEQQIKVIVTASANETKDLDRFRNNKIFGLYFNPVEKRSLLYSVTVGLNSPYSMYRFDNIGWVGTILQVNIGKKVVMERISEFGTIFRHNRPIAPGTSIFLHDGIYSQAPDGNLCSRIYFSEPHPTEKDEYLCSTLYFGINDAFLKYIRSWIRENYAAKKESQG